ncbi:RagB/SusD family nutrient uptake outer membrane protein [Puteibacter caeruleilacunae]|nr:RagB/SusD family nutrient uptake outer membrane protein [Puteibacter caeruleilacunae]
MRQIINYKKFQWILVSLLVLFNACDDSLDVNNDTILEGSKNYSTQAELSSNMLGIYSLMQEITDDLVVLNDLRSEQLEPTEQASADLLNIKSHNYTADNQYCNSLKYYRIVNACNDFIASSKRFLRDNPKADWTIVGNHIADAIKVRSYIFFTIGKLYGHAHYYTLPINTDLDVEKVSEMPDLTLDALLPLLIDDIESSDVDMFNELDWESLIKVSANFNFYNFDANVLLGDLYLWSENYPRALYYFKRAINAANGKYALKKDLFDDGDYTKIFSSVLTGADREIISAIEFEEKNVQIFEIHKLFKHNDNDYQLKPTNEIIEEFKNEIPKLIVNEGDVYRGEKCAFAKGDHPRVMKYERMNVPRFVFYRVAELHLKFCEALAMNGDFDMAYIFLNDGVSPDKTPQKYWDGNKGEFLPPFDSSWHRELRFNQGIRERVSLENIELPEEAVDWTDEEKQAHMLEWIFHENNLELCFEGKRYETALRYARRSGNFSKYASIIAPGDQSVQSKLSTEAGWYINW